MSTQLTMDWATSLPQDTYLFGERSSGETHGVVLTKPHIVGRILDLCGYTPDRDLTRTSLLEPACGHGAFLVAAVRRLLNAARRVGRDFSSLSSAIVAYDIDEDHVERSLANVIEVLRSEGVAPKTAMNLARTWITRADFLLTPMRRRFDYVVGNPPYIRIEELPPTLLGEYRARYRSLYDRADLYVAFIERGLELLSDDGALAFICADRWILNRYGAPLRRMITDKFQVRCYLDLHDASPFESEVIAYPSIFVIGRGKTDVVQVGRLRTASPEECAALEMAAYDTWFSGEDPWVLSSPEHLSILRHLESRFAPIDADGLTRVGIGVATGNDSIYIVSEGVDIEPERLVPLVMREDIEGGRIRDARRFVINTFDEEGVVDLRRWPRLARYLRARTTEIKQRHVSQKNPGSWFRTIDRVYPELVGQPKLLIPDIAGANEVVFDAGHYHPHHNLYYVVSSAWDLDVLGGLLSSHVALFFVWSYAVKMRGGYLRFQAQYLRRIRVPAPGSIPGDVAEMIREAFRKQDFDRLDALALRVYGLKELPAFDFVDTRGQQGRPKRRRR